MVSHGELRDLAHLRAEVRVRQHDQRTGARLSHRSNCGVDLLRGACSHRRHADADSLRRVLDFFQSGRVGRMTRIYEHSDTRQFGNGNAQKLEVLTAYVYADI